MQLGRMYLCIICGVVELDDNLALNIIMTSLIVPSSKFLKVGREKNECHEMD